MSHRAKIDLLDDGYWFSSIIFHRNFINTVSHGTPELLKDIVPLNFKDFAYNLDCSEFDPSEHQEISDE